MRESVRRLPDGLIALRLAERERVIVRALVGDLRTIIGETAPVPGLTELDEGGSPVPMDDVGRTSVHGDPGDPPSNPRDEPAASADPVFTRLYPDARPDDPAWSMRFRDMIRGDLDDARRSNLDVVEETVHARSIDDRQAEAWLHVLNDLRLVMGTRLDVTEESDEAAFDPEDSDAAAKVVYAYLGWLEGQFVDVLAASLPRRVDSAGPDDATPQDTAGS